MKDRDEHIQRLQNQLIKTKQKMQVYKVENKSLKACLEKQEDLVKYKQSFKKVKENLQSRI